MRTGTALEAKDTERVLPRHTPDSHHACVAVENRAQVARTVRDRRKTLELTQAELAERAKVSLSSVQRIEQGRRVDSAVERKVARALVWPPTAFDQLWAGEDPASPVAAFEAAQVEAKRLQLSTMTLEDAARIADFVAEVKGDSRAGDDFMSAFLRRRAEINSTESSAPEVG